MPSTPLFAYYGHHKCATGWINDIVNAVTTLAKVRLSAVDSPAQFQNDLPGFCAARNTEFLSYSNADIRHVRKLGSPSGFHVIRDPRDIVVSGYFSHLHSHKTEGWQPLIDHRDALAKVPLEEGLYLEMEFAKGNLGRIRNWDYGQENVLELRMESLTQSQYETFLQVFRHLGMLSDSDPPPTGPNIQPEVILAVVYYNRFDLKAKGRKRGAEDAKSHYRKGVAGDWRNHFTADHKRHFKQLYGDIVEQLGYDATDW